MLKIISILILISLVTSCGNAPSMTRKVKVWNGSPEESGICIKDSKFVANKLDTPNAIMKKMVVSPGYRCIFAESDEFMKFGCMTWDDIAVIQEYIVTLKNRCAKWKR